MKLTVLLREGDSWRIPVKKKDADVRWLIDEVARRHQRRHEQLSPDSRYDDLVREVVALRRANSALLELDDKLFEHCKDGGKSTV